MKYKILGKVSEMTDANFALLVAFLGGIIAGIGMSILTIVLFS